MQTEIITQLIELTRKEWLAIENEWRPCGVWIRQYAHVDLKRETFSQVWKETPIAVWYLSDAGVQVRNVDEWLSYRDTFRIVYSSLTYHEGRAAFAQSAGNDDYYWEYQWGPRWGAGWRVQIQENQQAKTVAMLWIS